VQLLLYTTEYRNQLLPEQLSLLVDKLPAAIQMKALRYRRWQDTYGCVFGNHLLRIALKRVGFSDNLSQLQYSHERKPFLPGGPHFNISHSANRVVCLMSKERKVGIDIEYITDDISFDDFQRQFTPAEWAAIRSSNAPEEKFYQFWTAKESIIKADGRGLGIPLERIDVSVDRTVMLDGCAWSLSHFSRLDGYACHFAVEDLPTPDGIVIGESSRSGIVDLEFYEVMPADFWVGDIIKTGLNRNSTDHF
jgi:4'-phosphopantetheinyl transferase